MQDIADILKINNKHDGYLSKLEYGITWAYGHLIEWCPPEVYGWKDFDAFLVLKDDWQTGFEFEQKLHKV